MSSRTSCCVSIVRSRPSRTTVPFGSVSSVSLSSVALLRSSCTMPMTMLAKTTPRNMASCQLPDDYHADGQQEEEHVEVREDVGAHNLPHGLAGRLDGPVVPAGAPRSSAWRVLRPCSGLGLEDRDVPPQRLF